ncbi:aminotransferase class III-fold pyridoxal phosphate-dependent enzyme, partial [Halomonas sp. 707D4]
ILEKSQALGEKLGQRFGEWQQKFDCVDNARHMGAMAAFELVTDKGKRERAPNPELAGALCKKAREEGLILLSCGMYANTIRFLMPVTIEDSVLDEGLDIIEACLESLT